MKKVRSEEKDSKVLEEFIMILSQIEQLREERSKMLSVMFWEYENLNISHYEDAETKFARFVPEKRTHPSTFLTSSLGFTKSAMQVKYNSILSKFNLEQRPVTNTLENALLFEKMKLLIICYYDMQKKKAA